MVLNYSKNLILFGFLAVFASGLVACDDSSGQKFSLGEDTGPIFSENVDPILPDVSVEDTDGDGFDDADDNCPEESNQDQADLDGDGVGDLCDRDLDWDGIENAYDNCPLIVNEDQFDTDGDGEGDVCDSDIDGDGVANDDDQFPEDPTMTLDADLDGFDVSVDCNDGDASIYPGAPETANSGVDSNCDGVLTTAVFTGFSETQGLGAKDQDHFGEKITALGDINADGFADFLVAAPNKNNAAGVVYLFLGSETITTASFSTAEAYTYFKGASGSDETGTALSAGDFNGDGRTDIAISAPSAYVLGTSERRGSVYVFFAPENFEDWAGGMNVRSADLIFYAEQKLSDFGFAIDMSGDANGDGRADLLIGSPGYDNSTGRAYLVFGSETLSGRFEFADLDATADYAIFTGEAGGDHAGYSVKFVGNANADASELHDFLISAPYHDDSLADQGKVYFQAGLASFYDASQSTSTHSLAMTTASIVGEASKDLFGAVLADLGDLNADRIADFAISAHTHDPTSRTRDGGKVYLFHGDATAFTGALTTASASTTILGDSEKLMFGSGIAAGDINNDGFIDLVIGASGADTDVLQDAGQVSVFLNSEAGFAASFSVADADENLFGIKTNEAFGATLEFLGDVDGDGNGDFALGSSRLNTANGTSSGAVYLLQAMFE